MVLKSNFQFFSDNFWQFDRLKLEKPSNSRSIMSSPLFLIDVCLTNLGAWILVSSCVFQVLTGLIRSCLNLDVACLRMHLMMIQMSTLRSSVPLFRMVWTYISSLWQCDKKLTGFINHRLHIFNVIHSKKSSGKFPEPYSGNLKFGWISGVQSLEPHLNSSSGKFLPE